MEYRQRYSNGDLDRHGDMREDDAWLKEKLLEPETVIYPITNRRCLVDALGRPVSMNKDGIHEISNSHELYFLGLENNSARFACNVEDTAENYEGIGKWSELREFAPDIPHKQAAIIAYASGLIYWHQTNKYCGVCGAETKCRRSGHMRLCANENCKKMHFPRTDPAVITLVSAGERCLLARRASSSVNRRSTIAGFAEPGETLEDAVRREIKEEVGVEVGCVNYCGSQPWPFPASLMMGFHAKATTYDILPDGKEISEADWYTRSDVTQLVVNGDLILPPEDSISRWLIDIWMSESSPSSIWPTG